MTTPRLIKLPEVMRLTSLGKTQIYSEMNGGRFPMKVTLGPKCVAWDEGEIADWIEKRKSERDAA